MLPVVTRSRTIASHGLTRRCIGPALARRTAERQSR